MRNMGGAAEAAPFSERRDAKPSDLERLLTALDADRERATVAYGRLHERITGLLRWWGATDAEDLTDLTLDRVGRKLAEGASIADGSFGAYVRGVARRVFYESRRRPQVHLADAAYLAPPASSDVDLLDCLDSCLDALDPAGRDLILSYYGDGKPAAVRRRLAEELGLTMPALRLRAHRLRAQLEQRVLASRPRR
jgi:hypothetical protein